MDSLIIEGVKPWDGRYEFDLNEQPPTQREWGWIRRLADYLPLTIDKGLEGGDPALIGVFAAMALYRNGKISVDQVPDIFERFQDVPFGAAVRLELAPVEDGDVGPPAVSSGSSRNGSGDDSRTSSESQAEPEPGTPALATSASLPAGSAT